jgi:hypothetical protein
MCTSVLVTPVVTIAFFRFDHFVIHNEIHAMEVAGVEPARKRCRSKYLCCYRVHYSMRGKELARVPIASCCNVLTSRLPLFSNSSYNTGHGRAGERWRAALPPPHERLAKQEGA